MKRPGFFKNAYRNVRKAYSDRRTTPIFFVIEVQSEEDSISKQAHVKLVNKQPSDFRFDHVLRCFREPILDFLKMFIGSSDHYE